MKTLFPFLLVSFSLVSNAQQGYVFTYTRTAYFPNFPQRAFMNEYRDRVICDKNFSFYYPMWQGSDLRKKGNVVDLEGSFYYDFRKQLTYSVHLMPKEIGTLLIVDSLIAGNWTFLNKQKKVKGYNCKLAVTENQNHDSTFVWYTEEIPLPFGPSGFIGFPGMVIEVLDVIGRQHYKLSSIKDSKEQVSLPSYKTVSRKEYFENY